jgi:hypothetical protein
VTPKQIYRYQVSSDLGERMLDVLAESETEANARVAQEAAEHGHTGRVVAKLSAVFKQVTATLAPDIDEIARGLAQLISAYLPPEAALGFCLFVYEEGVSQGKGTYVSSSDLPDMVQVVRGMLQAVEGQAAREAFRSRRPL